MAAYTFGQLETLWINAGGSKITAPLAAAIALAESSGEAGANSINPDGGQNIGLWQLDTKGKGSGYTAAQLYDPATNAKVAVAGSSDGKDWSAWATYPSPALSILKQHGGQAPASLPDTGQPQQDVSGGSVIWPGQIVGLFRDLDRALGGLWVAATDLLSPGPWIRAAAGLAGVVLLGFGLYSLGKAVM